MSDPGKSQWFHPLGGWDPDGFFWTAVTVLAVIAVVVIFCF